jgi:DNA-binding transcriptional ArsR family regulator
MNTQDEIFKAMADPSRREILAALCRESREAGELARLVGLAPNAASFHLRALKSAELVNVRREGRFLRYSIAPGSLQAWREQVDRMFSFDSAEPQPEAMAAVAVGHPRIPTAADDQLPTELL